MSLQAQVGAQLSESLQLHVENSARHQLNQPVDVLNRPANKQALLDFIKSNPDQIYVLVVADAYGTFEFDVRKRTIRLDFNARFTDSTNSSHDF